MTGNLEEFAAKLLLDMELPEGVANVAAEALGRGDDSPTLRALAVVSSPRKEEVLALLNRTFDEMGIRLLDPESAARFLAHRMARNISNNTVSPYEGAKAIWNLATRLRPLRLPELDPFIYAASEWEERTEDRALFERAIVDSAKELLSAS
jgi:hypothetical protein